MQVGEKKNMLECISETYTRDKKRYAMFRCDCGVEKEIVVASVKRESTKSCGCYNRKAASIRAAEINRKYKVDITHPLYGSWKSMKRKCYNPNADDYLGGRFIVCDEWKGNYEAFYNWAIETWSVNTKLRRTDEKLNFTPTNCYFASMSEIMSENSIKGLDTRKATNLERYGKEHYVQTEEYADKVKKISLEKYGVEHFSQNEAVKNKALETNWLKYGVSNHSKTDESKEKIRQTCLERFGTNSPSENDEIKQKQIDTSIAKYGKPFYNGASAKTENDVREFLESCSGKLFPSNHTILGRKEIDMYNEDLKVGIEYCGLRWHYVTKERPADYHRKKMEDCKIANVRLITVFSDEWEHRKSQVKNFLASAIGVFEKRLFARKCEVKKIEETIGSTFIERYHIQGKKNALVYFGIFNDGELLGVMSFARHHRDNTGNSLVLDRLAYKDGVQVVGGSSKLFKYGVEWAKAKKYKKIISWSDNRWSIGNVYEKIGFTMEEEMNHDYSYVLISNPKKRIPKQSCAKKHIDCKEGQTEYARMQELGYERIYDCGKKRWRFDIK